MIARAPISWLDKCRKYNQLIGYISNSNFKFKFSNSKQTFVFNLPVFAANRSFKSYQHFCFLCFHSRWRFFWFHKDREITKNLLTLAESNFSERKLSWTRLDWRNFICGNETGSPGRAVSLHLARSGSQSKHRIRRILPARGACHIIRGNIVWNVKRMCNNFIIKVQYELVALAMKNITSSNVITHTYYYPIREMWTQTLWLRYQNPCLVLSIIYSVLVWS